MGFAQVPGFAECEPRGDRGGTGFTAQGPEPNLAMRRPVRVGLTGDVKLAG